MPLADHLDVAVECFWGAVCSGVYIWLPLWLADEECDDSQSDGFVGSLSIVGSFWQSLEGQSMSIYQREWLLASGHLPNSPTTGRKTSSQLVSFP